MKIRPSKSSMGLAALVATSLIPWHSIAYENHVLLSVGPLQSDEQIQAHCAKEVVPDSTSGASRRLIEINAKALGITPRAMFQANCVKMAKKNREATAQHFRQKIACELRRIADILESPRPQDQPLIATIDNLSEASTEQLINLSGMTSSASPFTGAPHCP